MASANPSVPGSFRSHPSAYKNLMSVFLYFSVRPSNKDALSFLFPRADHSPFILVLFFTIGPIRATVNWRSLVIGKNWLLFFNKTIERFPISRAACKNSGFRIVSFSRFSSRYLYGSSNSPNMNFISSIRLTALSIVFSDTLPSSTKVFRLCRYTPPVISISTPAFTANSAACFSSWATPWGTSSLMAV